METTTPANRPRAELIAELDDQRRRIAELEEAAAETRRVLAALAASERKYRVLLDQSSDPIFSFSPDGCYQYVNPAFANGVGRKLEEIVGKRIWDVFPQDEADKRFAIVKWVFENAQSRNVEVRVPRPDGDRYYITTAKPILDDGARVSVVICISKEITEHRQAQAALRENEERMRGFFENIPVGIFISTREGQFDYINPVMPMIMGYDSCEELLAEVRRSSIAEALYVDPSARQTLIETLDRNPDDWLFYENRYRRKDGRIIDTSISIREKLDIATGEKRYCGIVTDITERKRIEAELINAKQVAESASLAKSRFLTAASHDLRQPIQAIGLFIDALAESGLSMEQERIRGLLSRSARSLNDLLDALLDISRLDSGVVKPRLAALPVETLFNKIDSTLSPLAIEKSLRFKLFFPARGMAIMTDGKLLMSLLGNLIGNSIKYTGQGGILVGIRRRGNQALVQVWDTGIGIASEHKNNVFEEYFQIGNAERDRTKGLGLGLAIARRLAKLLGADIVFRSRQGRGSVFELSLPLAGGPVNVDEDRGTSGIPAIGHMAGRRLVVVEDDVLVARAIELSMQPRGVITRIYRSAEDALADPEITQADFYLSDFQLSGMNGVQFLDVLQQRSEKVVRGVVLTGDTSTEQLEKTKLSRWTVLFKPIDLARLLSEIEAPAAR